MTGPYLKTPTAKPHIRPRGGRQLYRYAVDFPMYRERQWISGEALRAWFNPHVWPAGRL